MVTLRSVPGRLCSNQKAVFETKGLEGLSTLSITNCSLAIKGEEVFSQIIDDIHAFIFKVCGPAVDGGN